MKSAREIFHQGKFTNVKITSGLFRGRELKAPQNGVTHPMGSREKLALFNSLSDKIKDKIILDVFAGTGALGLEALSRGASHVTFIEADKKAAEILKQNAIVLGVFEQVRIYNTKAEKIDFDSPFDIVIADPPYEYFHDLPLSVLDRLAKTAREYFVLSHPSDFDPHAIDAELLSTKAYAGSRITIFRPHEA
ncbi:RsmD family RNA methyltransferase [Candidatus Nanosyncoccus nanoralicus]|mgnify:FL=1|jgi:ribosomal protein L11 methyltransferase (prmA)|uniref:Ribosomal RNA small subunit methyltransferase D n=1 Tax=Candidatus Nanosyncoccus nanoralicus TaxID=2171996 RepID=A0ABY0FKD7_9BACT|nr:RsmD family RNA methyltransferase [Candidatus Nanosyncoccus nanoralicus]RYC73824.1 Ribosomal RNA small subunit methyltransferase D [Candidatus Nanosyncoccus nanoralicus]